MSERTSYAPGVPSWVDLSTPDPAAAKAFYGELFGWTADDAGPPEETGGYAMFVKDGKLVAGVGPVMSEGQPAYWQTYFAVEDADAVAAKAAEAGAQVIVAPMDVMQAGRMAVFLHPGAGVFGIWQAGLHTGAQLVNEPGALTWNELQSRDVAGAKALLEAMFGHGFEDSEMEGMAYSMFSVDGTNVGGLMPTAPGVPDGVPSFWLTYFGVADADATVAKARELGATVLMEPMSVAGVGRFGTLLDPAGASFAVIQEESD
jgi:hypothetical protein